jgi:hypothetical protein
MSEDKDRRVGVARDQRAIVADVLRLADQPKVSRENLADICDLIDQLRRLTGNTG